MIAGMGGISQMVELADEESKEVVTMKALPDSAVAAITYQMEKLPLDGEAVTANSLYNTPHKYAPIPKAITLPKKMSAKHKM
jgi:hypothetical protein